MAAHSPLAFNAYFGGSDPRTLTSQLKTVGGNANGSGRPDLLRIPFGPETSWPPRSAAATVSPTAGSSPSHQRFFTNDVGSPVYSGLRVMTPPVTSETSRFRLPQQHNAHHGGSPTSSFRGDLMNSPNNKFVTGVPLDFETLRPLEHPLAVFATPPSGDSPPQQMYYSSFASGVGGTGNSQLGSSPAFIGTLPDSYDYASSYIHNAHAKLVSASRASIPPPPHSPDIYPTYHPSVVTPSSIPDEFAARLPLLTYNPRGPGTAYSNLRHPTPPVDESPAAAVGQSHRQHYRPGRPCTPLSSSRAFFRRTSRPTRPVPRRANLRERVSPRASSLEPPHTKIDPPESKHKRAKSAYLPSKQQPGARGANGKPREAEVDAAPDDPAPHLSASESVTSSKRPLRVPPLALGKILMSRDAPRPEVAQPGGKHQQQPEVSASGKRSLEAAAAGSLGGRQAVAEWLVSPLSPDGAAAAASPHLSGHWHSRQPTLTNINSQRYRFADVDSARAAPAATRFRPRPQPIAEPTSSSSSMVSSVSYQEAPRRPPLVVQRTVHLEWKSGGKPSSRKSRLTQQSSRNALQRSSVFTVFVDGDKF